MAKRRNRKPVRKQFPSPAQPPSLRPSTPVRFGWVRAAVSWGLGIAVTVIGGYLLLPTVIAIGETSKPTVDQVRQTEGAKISARGTTGQRFINASFRPTTISAELVPKGVVILNTDGTKRIERIPELFETSRAVLDITNASLQPFKVIEVKADHLINFTLVAERAVYVYRLRWLAEGQGEVASACLRIPMWKQGLEKVSPRDSMQISC